MKKKITSNRIFNESAILEKLDNTPQTISRSYKRRADGIICIKG